MKQGWRFAMGCFAIAVALTVGNNVWSRWDSARRVERIRAKLETVRQLGWATHASELPTVITNGKNAASALENLFRSESWRGGQGLRSAGFDLFLDRADSQVLKDVLKRFEAPVTQMNEAFRSATEFRIGGWDAGEAQLGVSKLSSFRTVSQWLLIQVVVNVRDRRFSEAEKKLNWHHRILQAMFELPQKVAWITAGTLYANERRYLLTLLNQGEPVEGLIQFSSDSVLAMNLDPSLTAQDELLLLISLPREGDEPAAIREPWEKKVRDFLKLKDPPGIRFELRQAPGYIPSYPKMQRIMEGVLDDWIALGKRKHGWEGAFERDEAISVINDRVWAKLPLIAGDDWEFSTPETRRSSARLLERPLVQASMMSEFLRAWKLKKQLGRWPTEGELRLSVRSRFPGATHRLNLDPPGVTIDSDTMPGSSNHFVGLRFPPKTTSLSLSQLSERRQSALEVLGMVPSTQKRHTGRPLGQPIQPMR